MHLWEIHPAVVHFPLAFILAAAALDLRALITQRPRPDAVAAGLLLAGAITGLVAAPLGLLAYFTVPAHTEGAHRMMFWHGGLAVATIVLALPVGAVRWRRRSVSASPLLRLATVACAVLVGITGFLGGHIILRGGAGVDPAILSEEVRTGHSHQHGHEHGAAPEPRPSPLPAARPGAEPAHDHAGHEH